MPGMTEAPAASIEAEVRALKASEARARAHSVVVASRVPHVSLFAALCKFKRSACS